MEIKIEWLLLPKIKSNRFLVGTHVLGGSRFSCYIVYINVDKKEKTGGFAQ